RASDLRIHAATIRHLLRSGLACMLQPLVPILSTLIMLRILAPLGVAVVAAFIVSARVVSFVVIPTLGLCETAMTLVGQNLGAGKPERARKAALTIGFYSMTLMTAASIAIAVGASWIGGSFVQETAVVAFATQCLRFYAAGLVFMSWTWILSAALNGA